MIKHLESDLRNGEFLMQGLLDDLVYGKITGDQYIEFSDKLRVAMNRVKEELSLLLLS